MFRRVQLDVAVAVALSAGIIALALALHFRLVQSAPAGRIYAGALVFIDDHLQYLSFAEQAARGAFLLRNKFDPDPQQAAVLVNLTWWLSGALSRLARLDVDTAFRCVGALGILLAAFGARALLVRAGLSESVRSWGTALFLLGSGCGWLQGGHIPPDAGVLLFPWAQFLLAPHTTVGTALLLWGLAFLIDRSRGASRLPWLAIGTLLGLTRPFDLGILVVAALGVPRARVDLVGLLPVIAYCGWVYGLHPSLGAFGGAQNVVPGPQLADWLLACGPLAVLATWALVRGAWATSPEVRPVLLAALGGVVVLVASPLSFALQFATAAGGLLLLALAGLPARLLPILFVAILPGSLGLVGTVWAPPDEWFAPHDYAAAAAALAESCRPGDLVVAPIEPSLFVAAHAPCHVLLGHRVLTPSFERRIAEVRRFYDTATPASERAAWLDTLAPRFVMTAPRGGGISIGDLGYRRVVERSLLEVWERSAP